MAGLKVTREIDALRKEMNIQLAAAVALATTEIQAIRTDGQQQIDDLKRRIAALESRTHLSPGGGVVTP